MKKSIYLLFILIILLFISGCDKNSNKVTEINQTDIKQEIIINEEIDDFSNDHTYEIVGKITEDMPAYHFLVIGEFNDEYGFVKGLRVYDENNKIIFKPNDSNFEEELGNMAIVPNSMETMGLQLADVNFDGFNDIVTLSSSGGAHGNTWYNAWLWNNSAKTFEYMESFKEICNPVLNYGSKYIYSTGGSGASFWGGSIYRFIDNEFVMTNNLNTYYEGTTETALFNRGMLTVRELEYGNLDWNDENNYYNNNSFWQTGSNLWSWSEGVFDNTLSTSTNLNLQGTYNFVGRIGEYPIHMELTIDGDEVSGSYYYDKYKQKIKLKGEYQGRAILLENSELFESFIGIVEDDVIKGYWECGSTELEFYVTKEFDALKDNSNTNSKIKVYGIGADMGSSTLTWFQPSGYTSCMIEITNVKGKDVNITAEANGVVYDKFISKANEDVRYSDSFIIENVPTGTNTLRFQDENGGLYETIGYINVILFKGNMDSLKKEEYLKAKYNFEGEYEYRILIDKISIPTNKGEQFIEFAESNIVYYEYYDSISTYCDEYTLNIYNSENELIQNFTSEDFFEQIYTVDMNFDGKIDIVAEYPGAMNQPKVIFLWDSLKNKFVRAEYEGFEMLSYYEIKDGYIKNFLKGGPQPEDNIMLKLEWRGNSLVNVGEY